jgi:hypothetical protein
MGKGTTRRSVLLYSHKTVWAMIRGADEAGLDAYCLPITASNLAIGHCAQPRRQASFDAPKSRSSANVKSCWHCTMRYIALQNIGPLGAITCGGNSHDRSAISKYFSHHMLTQVVQSLPRLRHVALPNIGPLGLFLSFLLVRHANCFFSLHGKMLCVQGLGRHRGLQGIKSNLICYNCFVNGTLEFSIAPTSGSKHLQEIKQELLRRPRTIRTSKQASKPCASNFHIRRPRFSTVQGLHMWQLISRSDDIDTGISEYPIHCVHRL